MRYARRTPIEDSPSDASNALTSPHWIQPGFPTPPGFARDTDRVLGLSNPTMVADRLLADGLSRIEVTDSLRASDQAK